MPDPNHTAIPPQRVLNEMGEQDFEVTRDPEEVFLETEALNAAARLVDFDGNISEVIVLVRKAMRRRSTATRPEDRMVDCAMARIVGDKVRVNAESIPLDANGWARYVTRSVVRAWIAWAAGDSSKALEELTRLKEAQHTKELVGERSGAVNLMTLYFWASAVEALAHGDPVASRKLWKRAMEVGSTFGTDSNLLVQWAYAGSFFRSA